MQLFQRACDEQCTWTAESDKQLESEEAGKDLQSVRFLLKKHEVFILLFHQTNNYWLL